MATLKTQPTSKNVDEFLNSVEDEQRRSDALVVNKLMKKITGDKPVMWGPSIVGFGKYVYKYSSGRTGEWMITGFSPRKDALTIYLLTGFGEGIFDDLLTKLGKFTTGKGCLYIKKLSDVDEKVLETLVKKTVTAIKSGKLKYVERTE